MSQVLKSAKVNYKGKSKFGGMSLALKHEDFDGFVQVKDPSIDLDGVEKGSIVDVKIEQKGKDNVVLALRVTGAAPSRSAPAGSGTGAYSQGDKDEFRMKHAQTIALELTKLMVEKGALKLGAQGKQQEQIEVEFARLSAAVYNQNTAAGIKALVEGEAEVDAEAEEPEAKPAAKKGKKKVETQADAFDEEPEGETADAESGGFDDDFDSK